MSLSKNPRQYLGVRALLPPDMQITVRNPTSNDIAYVKGTLWLNTALSTVFMWPGTGSWIELSPTAPADQAVTEILCDDGLPVFPDPNGLIQINGFTQQLISLGVSNAIVFKLDPACVAPGSLASTTTLVAGTGFTVTTGNAVVSAGNISTTLGSISSHTSLSAGTTITATAGAITATNGNLVLGTAGNKIISSSVASTTTAGANSFGKVTLSSGTATVSTTAVTANSIILLTRDSIGATGAAALGMVSVGTKSAGVSFVINALLTADATALATTDVSSISWMIIN